MYTTGTYQTEGGGGPTLGSADPSKRVVSIVWIVYYLRTKYYLLL